MVTGLILQLVGVVAPNTSSSNNSLSVQLCLQTVLMIQGDLARMLYNNKTNGGYSLRGFARQFMLTHMTRVTAVGKDWIEMERPLHVDVGMSHPAVLVK